MGQTITSAISLQGTQGPAGQAGPQGPAGPAGTAGQAGPQGPAGPTNLLNDQKICFANSTGNSCAWSIGMEGGFLAIRDNVSGGDKRYILNPNSYKSL
jgi:hypothetical protein